MKTSIRALTVLTGLMLAPSAANAQQWETPAIPNYGRIVRYDDAAAKPNPKRKYKLLFSISTDKETDGVNAALWTVARQVNLLRAGGVPRANIDIVVVFYGPGIGPALTDMAHMAKYERGNPNMTLLKSLSENGVTLFACGQTLATNKWKPDVLNSYVKLSTAALMVVANYQMDGYTLMAF